MDSPILPAPVDLMKRLGAIYKRNASISTLREAGSKPYGHSFRFLPSPLQALRASAFCASIKAMNGIQVIPLKFYESLLESQNMQIICFATEFTIRPHKVARR